MSHVPSPDPLDVAATHFARWRKRRRAPGGRVPAPLRAMACRLLERAPLEAVAEACAVAPATLDRWRERSALGDAADGQQADDLPSRAFVPLPAPSTCAVPSSDTRTALTPTLTIERPDGLRLHLHGPLEAATLALLLDAGPGR